MSRKIPTSSTLSKKAAAVVFSGLLVLSGTPIVPIAQALADEPMEVENQSGAPTNTVTVQNEGELEVEGSNTPDTTLQTTVGVQSLGEPAQNNVVTQVASDAEILQAKFDEGGTVTLDKDYVLTAQVCVKPDKTVVLQLNGHTISANSENIDDAMKLSSPIMVQNGGTLTIEGDGTIDATTNANTVMAIGVTKKGDPATNPATLTINGGTIKGPSFAISGNGKRNNTIITINGGSLTGNTSAAIYHPQYGTLTIGENASLTGVDSAIEIRSGNLIINGGTFTATANSYNIGPNGSGTTTKGAAIAVAQHTTKQNIDVQIKDGTFTGACAVSIANPQNNATDIAPTASITGGKFNGTTKDVDVVNMDERVKKHFISGGVFKNPVPEGLCASSMVPCKSSDANLPYTVGTPIAKPTASTGLTYNGLQQTGVVEGSGYTVANGIATNAGSYKATATPSDGYAWAYSDPLSEDVTKGDANKCAAASAAYDLNWSISAKPVAKEMVSAPNQTYDGKAKTPVVVKDGSTTLVEGTDYNIKYNDNTNAGTAKYSVACKGNYINAIDGTFEIAKAPITTEMISNIPSQVRTGQPIEPPVTVTFNGSALTKGTDYDVAFSNNLEAGEATATFTGKGNFTDSATVKFTITEPSLVLDGMGHVQNEGDKDAKGETSGLLIGTVNESKRLEAFAIELPENAPYKGSIEYTAHVQDEGWQDWKKDGKEAGTEGQSKRIEAVQIKLTDDMANHFDVWYRVHSQDYGWLGWAKNGDKAGTAGKSLRAEAIEVLILPAGSPAPGSTTTPFMSPISYQTHVQDLGWVTAVTDGAIGGTTGQSKRLEAIRINLPDVAYKGSIKYKTHIQDKGWESDYVKDGELSGTTGESKRLEAISIELEGEVSEHYDVWYRTHIQNYGWLGWASNGQNAGSQGKGLRMEAMEIVLVAKNSAAPGSTANAFIR